MAWTLLGRLGGPKVDRRWDLDTELVSWGGVPWTWRSAFESTMVMGATGSGKSSSSIAMILDAMARAGAGGCCFTVKREDAALYRRIVTDAGRKKDLVIHSPAENPLRFNVIAAEMAQNPGALGLAENLAALIMMVCELGDRPHRRGGRGSENGEYFRQATLRLCRFALLVLILSGKPVTVVNLHRLVISSPRSRAERSNPGWQKESFFFGCLQAAADAPKNDSQRSDFELALAFFMEEWADLSSRTRSTVESTLTSATDALSRGAARDSLSAPTYNFAPSMLELGKIVVLDYPILLHRDTGRLIQVVMKACIQRSLSRRDVKRSPRPVFLLADECQHLIVDADEQFATTSRSTNTGVVYATQSLSTLLEAFGGNEAEPRMLSFLGNMQTQIHHQQTCTRTISYLQQLTGRSRQFFVNSSTARGQDWLAPLFGDSSGGSAGVTEQYEFEIQASDLNALRKGGPPHFYSEALIYQGGRQFPNGRTWYRVAIPQRR